MTQMTTEEIPALVKRLGRPHASGGTVIERSVIRAEGANSAAILDWISDRGGVADSTAAPARSRGLHGSGAHVAQEAPAQRFVVPKSAFLAEPGD